MNVAAVVTWIVAVIGFLVVASAWWETRKHGRHDITARAEHQPDDADGAESLRLQNTIRPRPGFLSSATLRHGALLLSSLCLTYGLVEVAVRVWKRDVAFQPDPTLIRSLRPNVQRRVYSFDTPELLGRLPSEIPRVPSFLGMDYTNNLGFRMKEDIGPKLPGERRILLLGDSYTEADGVPDEQRFYRLVEESLNAGPHDGERWRVVNAAIQNGTPSQYILQLRAFFDQVNPDIVLAFIAPNDGADDYWFENSYGFAFDSRGMPLRPQARVRLSLLRHSWALRYFEIALSRSPRLNALVWPGRLKGVPHQDWQDMLCRASHGTRQWFLGKTGRYITEPREMSERRNARFGVFLIQYMWTFRDEPFYEPRFPDLQETLGGCVEHEGRAYQDFMEAFLDEHLITHWNPTEALRKEKTLNPRRKLWGYYDYHYSPAGHRVVAGEVVRFLHQDLLK